MPNLTAVILPAKVLSDGRHKIRIAVSHNGQTRYILTNIFIDSVREFKNGFIVRRNDAMFLNTKLRGILQHYQSVLDDLEYINGLTCAELVFMLKHGKEQSRRTIASIYDELSENLNVKEGTKRQNSYIWNVLSSLINPNMLMDNITLGTILSLDKKLTSRGLCPTTIRNYMAFFSQLVNYAIRCGYVSYRVNPKHGYKPPMPNVRESWLTVQQIRAIRDAELTNLKEIYARDIFMLSYYLGGINIIDLVDIDFVKCQGHIKYCRKKTNRRNKINKYVEFDIPQEAISIINKYIGRDGKITPPFHHDRFSYANLFTTYLVKIGNKIKIGNFIYYSARKSFAQHAFNLEVSTSVIDYILGHKLDRGGTTLYSYISVTSQMATDAIRKVIDNLDNTD